MLQKNSLVAVMVTLSLAACGGGGGSDTAVSANPPAPDPTAPPGSAPPGVDQTPISAPSPAPGKLPAPLPPPPPAPAGLQYSGTVLRQALTQAIAVIGNTGGVPETGQYVHDGLANPLAGYISSDGSTIKTRTLSRNQSGYTASRETAITLTESNGGLLPTVDGVPYTGAPLNYNLNYPVNQTAGVWAPATGSPYFVKLIPSTLAANPAVMKLCWHINTAAATRLACTYHHADGRVFGSNFIEDINGAISNFAWQWEATPRTDGLPYTLGDLAPGAIGGFPATTMSCIRSSFGPGNPPAEPSIVKSVSMTPSEVRVGDEVLLRHGVAGSTVTPGGGLISYTHTDTNPAAVITREYTLRAGELVSVNWGVEAGGSGVTNECVK